MLVCARLEVRLSFDYTFKSYIYDSSTVRESKSSLKVVVADQAAGLLVVLVIADKTHMGTHCTKKLFVVHGVCECENIESPRNGFFGM